MIDVGNVCFACDECPICEEWERRLLDARRNGYDFQFDHCGCDKVDAKFYAGGYCSDAFAEKPKAKSKGRRKTGRAFRRKMRRKVIKEYRDRDSQGWPIYGPYIHGHWDGDEYILGTYVEYPKSSKNKVFYKRVSNKKVRRSKDIPPKGNGYRKVFDYWWTIT